MSDKQVISIVFGSASGSGNTSTMALNTTIHRIGFFFTFNDAQVGTNDIAAGKLGFSITNWTTDTSLERTGSATGSCKLGTLNYTRVVSSDDFSYLRSATGPYIRIFMTTTYTTPEDIRIWLRLKIIGNTYKWYSLAFSYAGQSRNSVTYKIFDATATEKYIVYNGIYRLIELNQEPILSPLSLSISNIWGSLQTYLGQADSTITDIRDQTTTSSGTLSSAVLNKFYNNVLNSLKIYGGNSYTNPINLSPSINVGKNIPAWTTSNTEYIPCFELGKVGGSPTPNSTQPYYAQFGYQNAATSNEEAKYLSRVLMDYGSGNKKCVNKLVIFSPTPGYNTEWSKFEIVASTNGIDFIRLPTKWYTSNGGTETILETTFSLYWKRARPGNGGNTAYSIVPALDGARAQDVVANQTVYPANSYFPWSSSATATINAPLFMWNIDIDNTDEYRYYGFGNVGSDIYFNGGSTTLNTTHTRSPCGYSGFAAVGNIYTWASAGTTPSSGWSTGSNPTLNTSNITNISTVDKIRIFLPQISSEQIISAPTYYKYWRIRPTTSFLATIGTTFNLYFWKLGLYRTVDEANADTYGFSSNNYLQQYGNTMYINDTAQSPTNATAMFVHTGVWTDSTVGVINATAYTNLKLLISNSSSNIYFKLDVYGEIKAIRFPDFMNFDANVRGGTFILERGNAVSITSITSSGTTTATARTDGAHSYRSGDYVTITGSSIPGYNFSSVVITVPFGSDNTFTYTVTSGLGNPSGTITSILWEPMVLTKSNSADILARNGILPESSDIIETAAVPLTSSSSVYTIETVSEAATRRSLGTYDVPTTAGTPSVQSGPLAYNTSKTVTIVLSGGNNISYNTKEDFSIHFSTRSTPLDLSSILTKFNCTVNSYSSSTINFNTIPDFTGDGYFHIFIRNGLGTGITTNTATLVSRSVTVPPYAYILDDRVITTSSGSWNGFGTPPSGYSSWPITITQSNYIEYKPAIAGEYALVPSSGSEIIITNLTSSGGTTTATATTATDHLYSSGDYVCITGASQTGYNFSSVAITRLDNTRFTYTVASGLLSTATTTTTITTKKWQPITNKMFRATASSFNGTTNTQITGIKYLMIIENESCVFQTAAISNSVKWKATLSGKTVEVTSNKGTFSNSILNTTTGKYKTNFTFNNSTTASDWFSNVYVNGCPVTCDNNTLTSIGPLTSAKGIRFTTTTAGSVDAALGGLCGTDYVMHIEFKSPVTIQIDGFNAYVNDAGTYLGRGTSGTHTFANYPRFGAFNAYTNGFDTGSGTITNITSFISATTTICTGLGIPMLETNTNLAPVLSKAYGMPIDVNSSFNYYNGLTSTNGTAITFSQGYPSAFLTPIARTRTYTNAGLTPIDLYSSNWPWAGYALNNGSGSDKLPSGYFVDPTSGLPAIGNNSTLPGTIIRVSPANKKYVYINAVSNGWVIGGIKGGVSTPVTPFGASPSFRGTILDTTPSTLMTSSIRSINYTAISWVGCAFNNKTCLAPMTGAKQSFIWSGFYLGSGTAQASPALMTNTYIGNSKVIVWDIGLANGDSITGSSYSSATYITNNSGPNNVLTWTPLVGTNPDDRNTLHVFTLLINNNVIIGTDGANIDNWVQLYQNGKKLTRTNIINATNLRTVYDSAGGLKFIYNSLFTKVSNSADLSALFSGASTAGGTPAVNAYAVSTGTQWSFAENDVRNKASFYSESDVFTIMSELGTKWGIVPPIYHDSASNGVANVITISTTNSSGRWSNGVFNISRIGFFYNLENAIDGSNSLDLAYDGTNNRFGFDSSIDWGQISNSTPIDIDQRGTWWVATSGSDTLGITTDWGTLDTTGIPCGQFVRLSMEFRTDSHTLMTANAAKVRIRLILRHNSVPFLYGLEFSYNNNVYNTADNDFLSYDGSTNIATILAYKSIFRLVRSKHSTWAEHDASSDKWEWSNPYTTEMDSSSPSVTLGVAKNFAVNANSLSITNFTPAFKTQYLPPSGTCNMRRFYYASVGVNIPSWNGMWMAETTNTRALPSATATSETNYNNIYSTIDGVSGFTTDTKNSPLGNDVDTNVSDSLVRYMWYFSTATKVDKLMFYSGTPGWQSEWIKFEIVASNDGINFVRLPTEWYVSSDTVEETFHIKYNRKSKRNFNTFVFADTLTPANSTSDTNITAGKFLLTTANTRPIVWYVSFINDTKYKYYGFGNVGTDTPYYDLVNYSSNVTTRTYSRRPFSSSIAGTAHQTKSLSSNASTMVGYAVTNNTNLMANTNNLPWLVPSSGSSQGYGTAIIPIVSTGGANYGGSFSRYKYWRLRATSGFIGATGTAKAYFWKLGLYKNSADAAADTTGLSSNNYFQQFANIVSINGTVVSTTQSATTLARHKAICVNLGTWDQKYTNNAIDNIGGISGTNALGAYANLASFDSDSYYFLITLDVAPDITTISTIDSSGTISAGQVPVIRFPSFMRFDNTMGGTGAPST